MNTQQTTASRCLFRCPYCRSSSVLAIVSSGLDGYISFEATCRVCDLVEFAFIQDARESEVVSRWMSSALLAAPRELPGIEKPSCKFCNASCVETRDATDACASCGRESDLQTIWN